MTPTRSDGDARSPEGAGSRPNARAVVAAALSMIVPGLGAAYLGAWRRAASWYALGLALTGLLFLELRPRIAAVVWYLACVAALLLGGALDAWLRARSQPPAPRRSRWSIAALALLHFALAVPLTWRFLVPLTPYQITAQSMAPLLQPGDLFIARKQRWPFAAVERGSVVLFDLPDDPRVYVKRLVGLPNDRIDACGYHLHVNGEPAREPFVKYRSRAPLPGCVPVRVPAGQLYVLGDNRAASSDSRKHGTIPRSRVLATAWFVLLAEDDTRIGLDVR